MSTDQKPVTPKLDSTQANIAARLKDLKNVNRIVMNAINLINDVEIKGAHAQPVTEILGWLTGFSQSLTGQVKTFEATLPKKEVKPAALEDVPGNEDGSRTGFPEMPEVLKDDPNAKIATKVSEPVAETPKPKA